MKKIIISSLIAVVVIISIVWYFLVQPEETNELVVKPTYGKFLVTVTTTGELQAKNSIDVRGPTGIRHLGISQMKISRLVPEGSIVKKGDFVAELDKSEIMQKVKELELSIQKYEQQFLQAELDSTLNLAASRDELENLKFSLEERKLEMEQSIYEPPSIQRKAEIAYERADRSYNQSMKNYNTKVQQAMAKLSIAGADLTKEQQKMDRLMATFNDFTIKAPADGMVIYAREWNGRRRVVGSTISFWDPEVAKLPDLNNMESITFVSEVDIQKIKKGQKVIIGLDASPNKKLSGVVERVANIGEQKRNSDSKVFEVKVKVNEKDSTLLPAMTTSNEFIVASVDSALYIPLECLHTEGGKTFIYKKDNGSAIRQEVELGLINENEVVIKKGLKKEEVVFLSIPDDITDIEIVFLKKGRK